MPNEPLSTMFRLMTHTTVPDGGVIAPMVNGERRSIAAGSTLGDLLRSLELDPRTVVIEHNGVVLRDRDAYDSLALAADDNVEIVHFVGGG
jgi:thiamine biosynthesis protein ThiS